MKCSPRYKTKPFLGGILYCCLCLCLPSDLMSEVVLSIVIYAVPAVWPHTRGGILYCCLGLCLPSDLTPEMVFSIVVYARVCHLTSCLRWYFLLLSMLCLPAVGVKVRSQPITSNYNGVCSVHYNCQDLAPGVTNIDHTAILSAFTWTAWANISTLPLCT